MVKRAFFDSKILIMTDSFYFVKYTPFPLPPHSITHRSTFLAAKPSNTFGKAIEKVLDGFVKNGGI